MLVYFAIAGDPNASPRRQLVNTWLRLTRWVSIATGNPQIILSREALPSGTEIRIQFYRNFHDRIGALRSIRNSSGTNSDERS